MTTPTTACADPSEIVIYWLASGVTADHDLAESSIDCAYPVPTALFSQTLEYDRALSGGLNSDVDVGEGVRATAKKSAHKTVAPNQVYPRMGRVSPGVILGLPKVPPIGRENTAGGIRHMGDGRERSGRGA